VETQFLFVQGLADAHGKGLGVFSCVGGFVALRQGGKNAMSPATENEVG